MPTHVKLIIWKIMNKGKSIYLMVLISIGFAFTKSKKVDSSLTLWYQSPAQTWAQAFPLGNGRLAAMCFGGISSDRFQINEESLWAGCQINPYAKDFNTNLKKIQQMVLNGDYAKAHDFGVENLTARPTSFRSYQPFADLTIGFENQSSISKYKRQLDLSTGICKVTYNVGKSEMVRESFISAVDDVLCIRLSNSDKTKLNCTVSLHRFKDAKVVSLPGGKINLDGQITDVAAPDAYDDNPGGSGPAGKHMRFSGRLLLKNKGGTIEPKGDSLVIKKADEAIIIFTAATDYNLSILNFDRSIDPAEKAEEILNKAKQKTWEELKNAHIKEHSAMFDRLKLDLGPSANDSLPTDKRLDAFHNGAVDNGLVVQLFQFGRYLLMNSSRRPAVLPANLQGKWNDEKWAPWEADYHLNVNLQMNYWPADVTNLSETVEPLKNWFKQITEVSKPFAQKMYNSNGWFSCLATNPFGRVTPSASTPESQFLNGVLDPLAGAWMVMNLWDHYEYTQDKGFLKQELYPMLKGASEFILDGLIPDSNDTLQFVPSTSPENSYIDSATGRKLRITATSTYHLSIIKAVFEATLEASNTLKSEDEICKRIEIAEKMLPSFPVSSDGKLMEWMKDFKESEPGHRHLSFLLGVHPFALITNDQPELYKAALKSLDRRKQNGQGAGGGWSCAHASIMYAWFHDGNKAFDGLKTILNSSDKTLLNAHGIFQIDANFGATSCIAEMLIQSQLKDEDGNFILQLLPAIPSEWSTGSVKGLCARGDFTLNFDWKDGNLISASIFSEKGGTCEVRYKNNTMKVTLQAGERRHLAKL